MFNVHATAEWDCKFDEDAREADGEKWLITKLDAIKWFSYSHLKHKHSTSPSSTLRAQSVALFIHVLFIRKCSRFVHTKSSWNLHRWRAFNSTGIWLGLCSAYIYNKQYAIASHHSTARAHDAHTTHPPILTYTEMCVQMPIFYLCRREKVENGHEKGLRSVRFKLCQI